MSGCGATWHGASLASRFQQLNAIAEGIVNVNPAVAFQRLVGAGREAGSFKPRREARQVVDEKGRMRLARGTKIGFDAEVDLHAVVDEPAPAAPGKIGRLGNLREAEDALIEPARGLLAARRHS